MKKINSKQTGHGILSPLQSMVSVGMAGVWIGIVLLMYLLGINMYILLIVMCLIAGLIGVVFYTCIFDKARFNRIVTYFHFWRRKRAGKAHIHVLDTSLAQLKKHIPIETVHEDGMIQYRKGNYGALFRYDPPNVSSSEVNDFHKKIEYVVNSFGKDIEVSFHFYNMIDHRNLLGDQLLKSLNEDGKTIKQKQHLHSMYEEVTREAQPRVSTAFLMSIRLGKFKSVEHAAKAYKSTVPGILKSLRERGIYSIQVVGENEVAIEFKQFAIMESI